MKSNNLIFGLCFIFFMLTQSGFAQKDAPVHDKDSINAAMLHDYQLKLVEIEKQRVVDSMQKAQLEKRLNSLSTSDNLTKEKLLKELQELSRKKRCRLIL